MIHSLTRDIQVKENVQKSRIMDSQFWDLTVFVLSWLFEEMVARGCLAFCVLFSCSNNLIFRTRFSFKSELEDLVAESIKKKVKQYVDIKMLIS